MKEDYRLLLTYDNNGYLFSIENELEEKEIVRMTYSNSKLISIKAYKIINNNETIIETITLDYDVNALYRLRKSISNNSSYQYDVLYTFYEDEEDESKYLAYVDNIKGITTRVYLSNDLSGYLYKIKYQVGYILVNYYEARTRLYNNERYEDYYFSYDNSLLYIRNSDGLIKTYTYNSRIQFYEYKKLDIESKYLYEEAEKN